jgi:hypothetical protein
METQRQPRRRDRVPKKVLDLSDLEMVMVSGRAEPTVTINVPPSQPSPRFDERAWRENLKTLGVKGPWDAEPDDHKEWRHAGLPCIIKRGGLGNWCGYVAVPPGHPAHQKGYDHVDVRVHGGLTYADKCQGDVCHVPRKGESDDVWWLGFDCAHAGDIVPGLEVTRAMYSTRMPRLNLTGPWQETYKTLEYVKKQTQSLARQLAAMARIKAKPRRAVRRKPRPAVSTKRVAARRR